MLSASGIRPLGQFWGYARNRNEFRYAMNLSGFQTIKDGFIGSPEDKIYWISGNLS